MSNPSFQYEAPPRTLTEGRPRFVVLDGLRGVAALGVVAYHGRWWFPHLLALTHGYLAVDFFFMLSGFVIGFAYEDKLQSRKLSLPAFVAARALRLYPLLILGAALGAASYLLTSGHSASGAGRGLVLELFLLGAAAVPYLASAARPPQPYPLNGPAWSVGCEIVVNLIYAALAPVLRTPLVVAIVIASFVAEVAHGLGLGTIYHVGALDGPWWAVLARTAMPFSIGLLIYRGRGHIAAAFPRVPGLAVVLAVIILMTFMPWGSGPGGIVYELAVICVVFPIVIAMGSIPRPTGSSVKALEWLGAVSYPLYAIHYPLVRLYEAVVGHWRLSGVVALAGFVAVGAVSVGFAAALAPIDESVRKYLRGALARVRALR